MSSQQAKSGRIDALDFTKGMLVLSMVAYHSLNYSTRPELGFQYIAFLPPSFILITGFLLSRVYSVRTLAGDKRVWKRLLVRGGKLLALFTVLNFAASFVRGGTAGGDVLGIGYIINHGFDIYVAGGGRWAVFEVLLPIAYLILFAPCLLWLDQWKSAALPLATIAVLFLFALLEHSGNPFANGGMVGAGMLGMVMGRVSGGVLELFGRYWWMTLVGYGVYFSLSLTIGQPYLMQLVGAVVALAVFFGLGLRAGGSGWLQQRNLTLGKYSLVSYIVQIVILQCLSRFIGRPEPDSFGFVALLMTTLLLTVLFVEVIHWSRTKSSGADVLYKAVFA